MAIPPKNAFRINRKKIGLTYSCPIDTEDNPISDTEELRDFILTLGPCDYIIAEELHDSGKRHYHCHITFTDKISTYNERLFDCKGVHPEINNPGKGWLSYVTKGKEWISNWYTVGAWAHCLSMDSAQDAIEYLWHNKPEDMVRFGHTIEPNIRKRMKTRYEPQRYYGPYHNWIPADWDPKTHALLITGPPGVNKTQFARYIVAHLWPNLDENGPDYVKGTLASLKGCSFDRPIIFDEINMLGEDPEQSKEITDVENGGTIKMRYGDQVIPPGVPRIFLHNMEYPFRDPAGAVYCRRVQCYRIPGYDPVFEQFEQD